MAAEMDVRSLKSLLLCGLWAFASSGACPEAAAASPAATPTPQHAETPAPVPAPAPSSGDPIEEVVVSGEQPGPPLWKVSKGDHVMYVLGTLTPLPRNITWRSREVEGVIARAKQIVAQESVSANIGFFRGMRLLPAAMRARKNPDGAQLKDVLPADLYARWFRLKARYIGNDKGLEEWRPMLAGYELYSKALEKSGLARSNVVWPVIKKLAKKYDVPINEPHVKIDVDDPKGLIKDFTETPREADIACFRATLERLETDLEPMKQRASAWAEGDLETLQRLQSPTQEATCLDAITSVPSLQEEYAKMRAVALAEWMQIIETALARNDVTFAILPMSDLLKPNNRLTQLQAKGYTVEKP